MRRKRAFFLGGAAAILITAGWRQYSRRPRERVPSHDEGLDDPAVALAFNKIAALPHMRLLRWFVARRAAQMTQRGQAVDLGCGPGHLVIELARQAPGLQVTGIDLSDEMLERAEELAARSGVAGRQTIPQGLHAPRGGTEPAAGRVSFQKGDVLQILFPDNSLDLVVSTLSLHHWSRPAAVLDEIARVLRPGGSFLIFDLRRDMAMPFWLLMWFVTNLIVPSALRRVNEPLGSRDAAYTPQEAEALAEQSQLDNWRVVAGPLWLIMESVKTRPG